MSFHNCTSFFLLWSTKMTYSAPCLQYNESNWRPFLSSFKKDTNVLCKHHKSDPIWLMHYIARFWSHLISLCEHVLQKCSFFVPQKSWGWVNNNRHFIFVWTVPLRTLRLNLWCGFAQVSKPEEGYGVHSHEVHTHPVRVGQSKLCQRAGRDRRCQSAGFVFMRSLVILELETTITKPLPHEGTQKACRRTQR